MHACLGAGGRQGWEAGGAAPQVAPANATCLRSLLLTPADNPLAQGRTTRRRCRRRSRRSMTRTCRTCGSWRSCSTCRNGLPAAAAVQRRRQSIAGSSFAGGSTPAAAALARPGATLAGPAMGPPVCGGGAARRWQDRSPLPLRGGARPAPQTRTRGQRAGRRLRAQAAHKELLRPFVLSCFQPLTPLSGRPPARERPTDTRCHPPMPPSTHRLPQQASATPHHRSWSACCNAPPPARPLAVTQQGFFSFLSLSTLSRRRPPLHAFPTSSASPAQQPPPPSRLHRCHPSGASSSPW